MNQEWIHETVFLDTPDSFQRMSAEELQQAFQNNDPNRWGTWDRENHVMITVLWKDYPLLLSKLADLKAVCRKNEQLNARGYAGHDYHCGGFFSLTAGNQPMEGYRFSCRIGDVVQSAETVLFKRNRTVYRITCAGRAENETADHEIFTGILSGIRFQ